MSDCLSAQLLQLLCDFVTHYETGFCIVVFRPVIVISGCMSIHQEGMGAFQELNQV